MANTNFVQTVPNSSFFTDLDQVIHLVSLMGFVSSCTKNAFAEELISTLRNTKAKGYALVQKKKVAIKKKKS